MKKKEAMEHWRNLESGLPIMPHFNAIPYKATGSTYGSCGIRIDGNPAFIDAVLSRLQDLLAGENPETRLGLARNEVDGKGLDKDFLNKETNAEVCYVRLHERGGEAKMVNGYASIVAGREVILALTKTRRNTQ